MMTLGPGGFMAGPKDDRQARLAREVEDLHSRLERSKSLTAGERKALVNEYRRARARLERAGG